MATIFQGFNLSVRDSNHLTSIIRTGSQAKKYHPYHTDWLVATYLCNLVVFINSSFQVPIACCKTSKENCIKFNCLAL
jgi:hypothetical protein